MSRALAAALIALAIAAARGWCYIEELRPVFMPRPTLAELRQIDSAIANASVLDLKTRLTGVLTAQRERDEVTLQVLDMMAMIIVTLVIAIAGLLAYCHVRSRR